MAIFPERIDVGAGQAERGTGAVLRIIDNPKRQPLEVIALTPGQSDQLLRDLVRGLYPDQADEILALLP
jgi:hypothetical protein